jgi:predicted PurR-regulated permease PerM
MIGGNGSPGPAASIQQATAELQGAASGSGDSSRGGSAAQPSTAVSHAPTAATLLERGATSALGLVGNAVTIVFLVFFLLAAGDHFSRRLIEVAGDAEHRKIATRIVRDINGQIQRFLLVRAATGAIVAAATWGALVLLHTPQAAVWGLLAGMFNSIPYFGPIIVSGGLLVVGLVQSGQLSHALWMSGAALVITSLEGWLLTPPLLGKTERMSAVVIFLGLLFWTWVWGPWGTLLAVPMLVIMKAVADHVESLRWMSRLMAP